MKKIIFKKKYALISTYKKTNLNIICEHFQKYNISIISTGNTAKYINKLGYKSEIISDLTKFKEILDGRVKTLHPQIHASLLFKRSNSKHIKAFKKLNFPEISFVIVNLYPFLDMVKKNKEEKECVDMIDIGGPALLRSAAKNFDSITTICDPQFYDEFIDNLNLNNGNTNKSFRREMAQNVFQNTYKYDLDVNNWFLKKNNRKIITHNMSKIDLKYGENPNQKASVFLDNKKNSIFQSKIHGKKISYNNLLDIDSLLNCLNEFSKTASIIIKHNSPCGAALGNKPLDAFKKAISCDPKSAFGGILGFNRIVDENLAKKLKNYFFEVIVAKNFTKNALLILTKKRNLILIKSQYLKVNKGDEFKSINGGILKQEKNIKKINKRDINCVSKKKANEKVFKDLIFALKICKHVKSNSIVLAINEKTIGIGAGQMSRIDSTKIAVSKIINKNQSFVAASDAFFPFNDSAKFLLKNNCKSIIQPKGSINDKNLIKLSNEKKISLYFTNYRLFKH